VLVGLFLFEPPLPGERWPQVYNSVVTLGAAPPQRRYGVRSCRLQRPTCKPWVGDNG
jgi:hypothetical protein